MNKIEFFQDLEEIVVDPLFIGESEEDIDQEIANNTWSISISNELAVELSLKDFMDFFEKVISNRRNQITNSKNRRGMLFYVWFDWQGAQIRFNLISDYDSKLPFGCNFEIIENLEPIIEEFLGFPYHNGIPMEEITNEDDEWEDSKEKNEVIDSLKVFLFKINR
ncbi:hypothetical protein [Peribacillus alkalitolerans]|uniref:hypothetical protein n=1 Tax=Peribacillus alkalitolerans TaxID=1550385 RepID=UPI001967F7F9|nr:hypothetical protein [Peribacillus alkalitolerans]